MFPHRSVEESERIGFIQKEIINFILGKDKMISLRQKQNQEVLNEDLNANRRVLDRAKQRVAGLEENVVPRKQVDAQVEVGVTQGIMALNSILERKILSVEKALSGKSKYIMEVETSGDFVNAYNSIVALYNKSGLARGAQDLLKVRFQDLQTNLDAVVYGYDQLIDELFSYEEPPKELFNVIRASCVYREVQEQVFESGTSMNFRPLTQADIETKLKAVISDFSTDRQQILKQLRVGADMGLTRIPLRNFPVIGDNIAERIEELEAERGITLPESVKDNMRRLAPAEIAAETADFVRGRSDTRDLEGRLVQIQDEIGDRAASWSDATNTLDKVDAQLAANTRALDNLLSLEREGEEVDPLSIEEIRQSDAALAEAKNFLINALEENETAINELRSEKRQLEEQLSQLASTSKPSPSVPSSSASSSASSGEPPMPADLPKRKDGVTPRKTSAEYKAWDKSVQEYRKLQSQRFEEEKASVASSASSPPRVALFGSPVPFPPLPEDQFDFGVDEGKDEAPSGRGRPQYRGLASMKSRYHKDSSSESDSESDEDEPRRRNPHRAMFSYNHRDNDMYC